MDVIEYLLDGLEAELALERELGVRSVPFDRSLLEQPHAEPPPVQAAPSAPAASSRASAPGAGRAAKPPPTTPTGRFDFVFLHDRPLSEKGVEMMAKIVVALGRTAETAPIVLGAPLPEARAYVVLGGLALRKFFPGLRGSPGQWLKTPNGADVLVSNSPEYILRFDDASPELKTIKANMWRSLKAVRQRFGQ